MVYQGKAMKYNHLDGTASICTACRDLITDVIISYPAQTNPNLIAQLLPRPIILLTSLPLSTNRSPRHFSKPFTSYPQEPYTSNPPSHHYNTSTRSDCYSNNFLFPPNKPKIISFTEPETKNQKPKTISPVARTAEQGNFNSRSRKYRIRKMGEKIVWDQLIIPSVLE